MSGRPTVPAGIEARKILTVVFADLTESTSLGQALDPEALRHLMARWYEVMRRVVERHDGVVAKFIGDAVMAVFGVPHVHEDDALRAVRAAAGMRVELAALNEELEATWGVSVGMRTGVNTGEVLVRDPNGDELLVVGDAVNVAARLEQAAAPGEILLGEVTHQLVCDGVTAERAGPLELKGIAPPAAAWRLLDVVEDGYGRYRRLDSLLVGRERELAALESAFADTERERSCGLALVVGPAGVGKSRLVAEFVARVSDRARVLQGRCLPYGEGITFWPVAAVIRQAAGIEAGGPAADVQRRVGALLAAAPEAAYIRDGIAGLLGLGPSAGIQETFWAARKTLELLASEQALVVVFDDVQWGEPTFLDLVEYLADRVRAAPLLLVCQTRPELLDARPSLTSARAGATLLPLAPLDAGETEALLLNLADGAALPAAARGRITEVGEGNPLFVEELLRLLVDTGVLRRDDGEWTVAGDPERIAIPPTIHALLAARLDRLSAEERVVVERASVLGRFFWWSAVAELAPAEIHPRVGALLQALTHKGVIRPSEEELGQEDAFEFTHILIRDAAYQGLSKAVRADLHERFADWIMERTRERAGEYDEIVGYHLEQANHSLLELGFKTPRARELAHRAASRLAAAGDRAYARGDMPAAVNLLSRTAALLDARDETRLRLLDDLGFAQMETGDFEALQHTAAELERAATATGDPGLQAQATMLTLLCRLFTDPKGWATDAEGEAARAVATFGDVGDQVGLARANSLLGIAHMMQARFADAERAWEQAAAHADAAGRRPDEVEHAHRDGSRREKLEALAWVAGTVWLGPTPAEEGIRRCREVFDRAQGDRKAMATALFCQAGLEANLGRFDDAKELFERARVLLEEIALPVWMAGVLSQALGWALLLEDKPALAEAELRRGYETLRAIGEVSFLSTVAGILAEAIYAQGRYDEADRFTRISEEAAGVEDVYSQVLSRSVRAKCVARQGKTTEAVGLARESVTLVGSTDSLNLRWHALMSQAEVLHLAGRTAEAETALEEAISAAEQKENLVGARLAHEAMHGLSSPLGRRAPGTTARHRRPLL